MGPLPLNQHFMLWGRNEQSRPRQRWECCRSAHLMQKHPVRIWKHWCSLSFCVMHDCTIRFLFSNKDHRSSAAPDHWNVHVPKRKLCDSSSEPTIPTGESAVTGFAQPLSDPETVPSVTARRPHRPICMELRESCPKNSEALEICEPARRTVEGTGWSRNDLKDLRRLGVEVTGKGQGAFCWELL